QSQATLARFLGTLREAQERLGARHGRRCPLLLKIAPDLSLQELDAISDAVLEAGIDGVVCTNTTVARDAVDGHVHAHQAGGLSGAPLLQRSTEVLRGMRARIGDKVPLVGVGGITQGAHAAGKIAVGATLVQFYSGMVYRGPGLVAECVEAIRAQAASQPSQQAGPPPA